MENEKQQTEDQDDQVSRRALAKKIAYIAPVAFAVIAASEQPLAASSIGRRSSKVPRSDESIPCRKYFEPLQ